MSVMSQILFNVMCKLIYFGMHDNMFRFLQEYEIVTVILKVALMGPKPLENKTL